MANVTCILNYPTTKKLLWEPPMVTFLPGYLCERMVSREESADFLLEVRYVTEV